MIMLASVSHRGHRHSLNVLTSKALRCGLCPKKDIDREVRCVQSDGWEFASALVGEAFGAVLEPDDAAVGEAVLQDEVLHDAVVAVGVDAEMRIAGGREINDRREDSVGIRVARHSVDDAVRLVGEPGAVDVGVGGFGRRKEGEVADNRVLDSTFGSVRNGSVPVGRSDDLVISTKRSAWRDLVTQKDVPATKVDVAQEEVLRREAGGGPLLEVAVGAHDGLGGLEDGSQGGEVNDGRRPDNQLGGG